MVWFVLIGVAIAIVVALRKLYNEANADVVNTNHVRLSNSQPVIDQNFVKEAVQFFDGFLTFCAQHRVLGRASLLQQGTAEHWVEAQLKCKFFTIDDEHAEYFFSVKKIGWENAKKEVDLSDRIHAGDAFMKSVYGCDDLHYAYTDIDEYIFGDPDVVISCETSLFTMEGAKWEANLNAIRQELRTKWPNATIKTGMGGIVVEAN